MAKHSKRKRERLTDVRPVRDEPTTEEKFALPPEVAEEIEDDEGDRLIDRVLGDSAWLRTSG